VDAIVGAPKRMHTVLTVHCTGCELCVPPCPVDCITMIPVTRLVEQGEPAAHALLAQTPAQRATEARARFAFRHERVQRDKRERDERLAHRALAKLAEAEAEPPSAARERRKAIIEAALSRARVRLEREERDRAHRETDNRGRMPGDTT
jgi:electron transport complex protein RnfB